MPTAAQILADRRATLNLPVTIPGLDGDVKVTGELCDWVEMVTFLGCPIQFGTRTWTASGRYVLLVGMPYAIRAVNLLKVEFDKYGRWTQVIGDGGHWGRSRQPDQTTRAIEYYRAEICKRSYQQVMQIPNPPQWAVDLHSHERAVRTEQEQRQARQSRERLLQDARTRAINDLIAAHQAEYDDLVEAYSVEAALTS